MGIFEALWSALKIFWEIGIEIRGRKFEEKNSEQRNLGLKSFLEKWMAGNQSGNLFLSVGQSNQFGRI